MPLSSSSILAAERPVLHLYVAGVGTVGAALLQQIGALPNPAVRLVGACTSRHAVWAPESLEAHTVRERLAEAAPPDWPVTLDRLAAQASRPLAFVDVTGSAEVARFYPQLLGAGIHVVTASKLANTFEQAYFDRLVQLAEVHGVQYRYETNVGAGLPVVQTVQDLLATGDRVQRLRGAASGTLTYLFTEMERGVPFSRTARDAVAKGYAEPDVRDDLSGEDVARKFLILARTAGFRLERSRLEVESLVPDALKDLSPEDALDALSDYDAAWQERVEAARREDRVLRYVGTLHPDGRVQVGVEAVPSRSPLGGLTGTDNLFEISTTRYAASPLTVQGPGAGPDVTAAGVLSDVLQVARSLPTWASAA